MVDAKYVNMEKINFGYDGYKFIDLSGIDIGFPMAEFQKILDERRQTLMALWLERARRCSLKVSQCNAIMNNCKIGEQEKYDRAEMRSLKYLWAYEKCLKYAAKFKEEK